MRIISNAMLTVAGVYLALGVIYLRFWWAERARLSYLAFTISCFSYMAFSWFELGMQRAQTPEEYLFYAWWAFVPGVIGIISFGWFAYLHLQGRKWLFWTHSVLRLLALLLHFVMPNGIHFREITAVGHRTVLGETLSYPISVPNPWMSLSHFCNVLLVFFFLDASIRCWRCGERRQAVVFGTGTVLFGTITVLFAPLVFWGLVPFPLMNSFTVLFIIAAMLYELNYELHHAAMLTEKLEERETRLSETLDQLQLSAAAANVGMWTRKIGGEIIWISKKAGEILGAPSGEHFTREDLLQYIHPDDRELLFTLIRELENGKDEFQLEYRILLKDGKVRWIHSRGKVETVNGSRFIRGAVVDITKLKTAEGAVRELSHKVMNALEGERARLARELHDDLSQSISLLSIQLTTLRNEPRDLEHVKEQLDRYISDVSRLSNDVRRISHELHPSMLSQLGLEAALHRFCGDLAAAHSIEVDFKADNLPAKLPIEISLCLYRVTQESLQNVVKHSHATAAYASIKFEQNELFLSISDNGDGFQVNAERANESLGLISIHERVRVVNGTVKITSRIGAGTQIEVHVPFENNSEIGITTYPESKITVGQSIRVVVADDNKLMLETIVGIITPHFDVVGTAADGKAAVEIINRLKPDIAVLDVSMPFKTGIEVAAELKTSVPEVKVVIVSANDETAYIRAARRAGAVAYVVKTALGDGLIPALKSAYAGNVFIASSEDQRAMGTLGTSDLKR